MRSNPPRPAALAEGADEAAAAALALSEAEAVAVAASTADVYDFEQLLGKPKSYKVRLYVMRGTDLAAMDEGWGGRPGKSDPYLRAHIGKQSFDDRENFIENECVLLAFTFFSSLFLSTQLSLSDPCTW